MVVPLGRSYKVGHRWEQSMVMWKVPPCLETSKEIASV